MGRQTISQECYNRFSNTYCPDQTFFQRVGGEFLNPQGCFYFNSTEEVVDQVSITAAQTTQAIAAQQTVTQVAVSKALLSLQAVQSTPATPPALYCPSPAATTSTGSQPREAV